MNIPLHVDHRLTTLTIYLCCFWVIVFLVAGGLVNAQDAFLPLGNLQPASQDDAVPALQVIANGLKQVELSRMQGDTRYEIVSRDSEVMYDGIEKMLAKLQPSGQKLAGGRNAFLGPKKVTSRWVSDGIKVAYDLEVVRPTGEAGKPQDVQKTVFDGTYTRRYVPAEQTLQVLSGHPRGYWPESEALYTIEKSNVKPTSDLLQLPGAKYEGHQTVGSVDCFRISVPLSGSRVGIWLTCDDYCAKRMEVSSPGYEPTRGLTIFEVAAFARTPDGVIYPEKGTMTMFSVSPDGKRDWGSTVDWSVVSYSSSPDLEALNFRAPSGTRVTYEDESGLATFTTP